MGIKDENIFDLHDSQLDEILAKENQLREKVQMHAKNGRKSFVYIYAAGHGCSDTY